MPGLVGPGRAASCGAQSLRDDASRDGSAIQLSKGYTRDFRIARGAAISRESPTNKVESPPNKVEYKPLSKSQIRRLLPPIAPVWA